MNYCDGLTPRKLTLSLAQPAFIINASLSTFSSQFMHRCINDTTFFHPEIHLHTIYFV